MLATHDMSMRSFSLRRLSLRHGTVALLGTLGLGACSSITDNQPSLQKYGAVNFLGKGTADGKGSASATVVAFESLDLLVPNSSTQQNDQCVFAVVDTLPSVVRGDRSAGETVSIAVAGASRQLPYSAADFRYATAGGAPIAYSAGDVATVSIPGDGNRFPALSGSLKLAEPLTLGPLALPAAGENLTVTWNATNDPTAAIILQVKYPNPVGSSYANEQVYCALRDDGSVVLPGALLNAFQLASSKRSLTLIRWRTNFIETSAAGLHLASSIDTTVVFP
jgi:hypothetical protein